MRIWMLGVLGLVFATAGFGQDDWPTHGGDSGGTKYSTLDQIRRDNVHELAPVWTWETGDEPIAAARVPFAGQEIKPGKFQGTPVVLTIEDGIPIHKPPYSTLTAIDLNAGELVWQIPLGGGGFGNPITYRTKSGKQLIVIATSQSDGTAPKLIAFGLPS